MLRRHLLPTSPRRAFTIVELLVSLALVIFIMSILSEAFVAATTSFLTLKAIGDLDGSLRTVATLLRSDLAADHFGGPLLSGIALSTTTSSSPTQGFFRIYQGTPPTAPSSGTQFPPYAVEGTDADGIYSYRATNHMLHFTVNLSAPSLYNSDVNRIPSFFSAIVPPGVPPNALAGTPSTLSIADYSPAPYVDPNDVTLCAQWAEVAWFLRSNGTTANGTPLFNLYRRQLAVLPTLTQYPTLASPNSGTAGATVSATTYPPLTSYPEVSCVIDPTTQTGRPGQIYFNTTADLTAPIMRFGMYQPGSGGAAPSNPNAGILTATDPIIGPPYPNPNAYPKLSDIPNSSSVPNAQGTLWGRDVVLTNVVSFDVKISLGNGYQSLYNGLPAGSGPAAGFMDLYDPALTTYVVGNPAFSQTTGPMVFDTWCTTTSGNSTTGYYYNYSTGWNQTGTDTCIPLVPPPIQAIQVIIRVWDPRTEITRQMTLVQNM